MKNGIEFNAFCAEQEASMKEKLSSLEKGETDLVRQYSKGLSVIASHLSELKAYVASYRFADKTEEIYFFKNRKPVFLTQYFFFQSLLEITAKAPARINGALESYYTKRLEQLWDAINSNREFVQYCRSGVDTFDDKYFVRGFIPDIDFTTDRTFSTGYDERLSRALADHLLTDHIYSLLEKEKTSGDNCENTLTWTCSKADLIELIYGLVAAGAVNKGRVDIKEIASRFEFVFDIKLGNLYRQFLDIRLRKKERTVFINLMKEKLEKKMDDFN